MIKTKLIFSFFFVVGKHSSGYPPLDFTCQRDGLLHGHAIGSLVENTSNLTHVDYHSNLPTMVDVSSKHPSEREAHARCLVRLPKEVAAALQDREIQSPKGPVFATAIIAGTMAAKRTSDLIPFCHPLFIEKCQIRVSPHPLEDGTITLQVDCHVKVSGKTGVEMEALTGCSVAALTIYDMCKALSHKIVIDQCQLIHKSGGKSDFEMTK
jgi:cyclic pyranopterin monophosphate synthase